MAAMDTEMEVMGAQLLSPTMKVTSLGPSSDDPCQRTNLWKVRRMSYATWALYFKFVMDTVDVPRPNSNIPVKSRFSFFMQ